MDCFGICLMLVFRHCMSHITAGRLGHGEHLKLQFGQILHFKLSGHGKQV